MEDRNTQKVRLIHYKFIQTNVVFFSFSFCHLSTNWKLKCYCSTIDMVHWRRHSQIWIIQQNQKIMVERFCFSFFLLFLEIKNESHLSTYFHMWTYWKQSLLIPNGMQCFCFWGKVKRKEEGQHRGKGSSQKW